MPRLGEKRCVVKSAVVSHYLYRLQQLPMKQHTTNYTNTFIQVANDCTAHSGERPPVKEATLTVANMQFDLLQQHPYKYTSDDVVFEVYAKKNDLSPSEREAARIAFFSKGQPCLRSSPLAKRYGWGFHHDAEGRVAMYPLGSKEYDQFAKDKALAQTRAMRSTKAS